MTRNSRSYSLLSPLVVLLVFSWLGDVNSVEYNLGNPFGIGQWQGFPFNMPQYPPFFQQLFYPNWGFQPSFFPQLPAVIVSQVEQVMDYLIDATSLDSEETYEDEGYEDEYYDEDEPTTTTTTTTTKKPTTPKKKRPRGK